MVEGSSRKLAGVLMVLLGCLAVLGPFGARATLKQTQLRDVADIRNLRHILDSTRAVLAGAGSGADSLRFREQIRSREAYLTRREYHMPVRENRLRTWWRPGGAPSVLVTAGLLLVLGGMMLVRRR